MLLQLDPDKMAQLGITVSDVAAAVREQNATNPAGRLGPRAVAAGTQLTLPVTTIGRLQTPEQFDDIIVRARPDGSLVRLRDIGRAKLGARSYDLAGRLNGSPDGVHAALPAPRRERARGAQAVAEADGRARSRASRRACRCAIPFDTTPFVTRVDQRGACITLVEAMMLVTLVVFLFLQSWRATLIPMLAVPVQRHRHVPRPAARSASRSTC